MFLSASYKLIARLSFRKAISQHYPAEKASLSARRASGGAQTPRPLSQLHSRQLLAVPQAHFMLSRFGHGSSSSKIQFKFWFPSEVFSLASAVWWAELWAECSSPGPATEHETEGRLLRALDSSFLIIKWASGTRWLWCSLWLILMDWKGLCSRISFVTCA